MEKKRLRVLKWLATVPAVAVCTLCDQEFKVPLTAIKRLVDAQESLERQFEQHQCKEQ
jgi:hypothetical protein